MSPETRIGLVRAALLFVPVGLAGAVVLWRRPTRREWAGVLVASVWTFVTLMALNLWAVSSGLWSFGATGGTHRGIPLDIVLGWTTLWAVAFPLAFARTHVVVAVAVALWLDLLAMPVANPVIRLESAWLWGESATLLVCFLPAQWIVRWTRDDRRLETRATLQALAFGGFAFWLLGDAALVADHVGPAPTLTWWLTPRSPGWLVPVAFGALLSLVAVHEFAGQGRGTPLPWDPPKRLVIAGPYRYIRNPMQLGMWIALPCWGLAYGSAWLVGGALVLVAFSAGLAQWHEREEFIPRFGGPGRRYRIAVPWGYPKALPYVPDPPTLYYGAGCDVCESLARWLEGQKPIGLELRSAQEHPAGGLTRLTYRHVSGREEQGLAALARAFEHLHVLWAFLGSVLRLPVLRPALQRVIDASGGGPRSLPTASVCE